MDEYHLPPEGNPTTGHISPPPPAAGAGTSQMSERGNRNVAEHAKFEAARPENAGAVRDASASFLANLSAQAAYCKATREAAMKNDFCACHRAGHTTPASIVPVPNGKSITVRVINIRWQYDFVMRELTCTSCDARRMPTAHDIFCYASQAEECQTGSLLFARELLEYSTPLLFRGTSFTNLADSFSLPKTNEVNLLRAWLEYRKCIDVMSPTSLGVTGVDDGPFALCPVCAVVMADGAVAPQPKQEELKINLCLCTDASNTPDRLQCGSASGSIGPSLSTFIGTRHKDVMRALDASRKAPPSSSLSREQEKTAQIPLCGPGHHYKCGAVDPAVKNVKASEGLMGCVCKHGIPLLNSFASMDGCHECFIFYDVMFNGIVMARPDLKFANLDFGCKYEVHFQGPNFCILLPEGSQLTPEMRQHLRVVVPYMHSQSHVVVCRLVHGGLFADGSGWMVGEQTEQLWSQSKPWSHIIRSMSDGHRIDFVNLGLAWIARRKAENIFSSLRDKLAAMLQKQAKMLVLLEECYLAYNEVHACGIEAARVAVAQRIEALTVQQKASAATAAANEAAQADNFEICQRRLALSIVKVATLESQFTPDGAKRHTLFFPNGSRPSDKETEAALQSALIVRHQLALSGLGWLVPEEATLKPFEELLSLPSFGAAFEVAKQSAINDVQSEVVQFSLMWNRCTQRAREQSCTNKVRAALLKKSSGYKAAIVIRLLPLRNKWLGCGLRAMLDVPPLQPGIIASILAGTMFPWDASAHDGLDGVITEAREHDARFKRAVEEVAYLGNEKKRATHNLNNYITRITCASDSKVVAKEAALRDLTAQYAARDYVAANASLKTARQLEGQISLMAECIGWARNILSKADWGVAPAVVPQPAAESEAGPSTAVGLGTDEDALLVDEDHEPLEDVGLV